MIETLYVHRQLLNPDEVVEWAKQQGFPQTLYPDDMHVTVAFSKKAIPWANIKPNENNIHVKSGPRDVITLGEKGALVLRFDHPELHERWQQFLDHGASWDHEGYHPHITLTYQSSGINPENIKPFMGPLILGPEIFKPVEEDWDTKIDEVPTEGANRGVLENKRTPTIKYTESIMENKRMNDSLASLLMKNIDLILEAFNVDNKGNLIESNKKKVAEADEIFHDYFVKRMNQTFRQINEADPILSDPMNMHPQGTMHGMHGMGQPHGMGMGMNGEHMGGMGGDEQMGDEHMGDMAMDDMHAMGGMDDGMDDQMGGMQHGGMMQHGGGMPGGGMSMGESQEYDWVFGENTDLEIDSLFNLTEDDDDDDDDDDEDRLDEFMDDEMQDHGGSDFLPNGMDDGGANDFGGDMGGMDDMGGDDMGMGGDEMGGDMQSVHGHFDNGGEFEFKFDPETLGFDGGDMGGDEGGMDDMHMGGHEESPEHTMDQPGMGGEEEDENPMHEAAGGFHNGKPGKGNRGPKTARMAVVPDAPASNKAVPFPSPMGNKRSKK